MCMFFIQCSMQLLRSVHVSDTNQEENDSPLMECIPLQKHLGDVKKEPTGSGLVRGLCQADLSVGVQKHTYWVNIFFSNDVPGCVSWARAVFQCFETSKQALEAGSLEGGI